MVRVYKRKTNRGSYGAEKLQTALEQIRNNTISLNRAHKLYNIPKATLSAHKNGKRGQKSTTQGRTQVLSPIEEKELADCLKTLERWGFGLSRKEVSLLLPY